MASFVTCDRCGKRSPDERGRHIANDWVEIHEFRYGNTPTFGSDCRPIPYTITCVECLKVAETMWEIRRDMIAAEAVK